jgi:hypothetical protein
MKLQPKVKPETKQERAYNQNDPIQTAIHNNDWTNTSQRPDKKCKMCYGRGNLGYNILSKKYLVCKCVKIPN